VNQILLIAPQPFFTTRGTPINVRAMAETLIGRGYCVTVLTLPFGTDIPGIEIKRVPRIPLSSQPPIGPSFVKFLYSFLIFIEALKLTAQRRFCLIHGVEEAAIIGGAVGLIRKIPYVADIDSCMVTQLRDSGFSLFFCDRLFETIENFFIRRARAAITVCDALTKSVRRRAPLIQIYQIEDFPLEESLVVSSARYEELKVRFYGKRILLYTGNLEKYQGVELLIRSYAKCLKNVPSISDSVLVIVGGNDKNILELKELTQELGIESNVAFEGARPASEMGAYMAASDFLLSPRIYGENVPLKLYTYLAAGKPLIATNIYSHTQIIDNDCAFLGEPNIDGFSQAISAALLSSEIKIKAQTGLKLVETLYSKEAFKHGLLDAYSKFLPLEESAVKAESIKYQTR
jgi:glycosyltransferase involved in cell wall biosynthesis